LLAALIAEADAEERRRLGGWLREAGFAVSESSDGSPCPPPAGGFHLALISAALMRPCEAPGMRRLHLSLAGEAPAIGLVGWVAAQAESTCCLEAGMSDILLKPVERVDLLEGIEAWCPGAVGLCPVDLPHLARYTAGDVALERELWQLFLGTGERQLRSLAACTTAKDWHLATHSLKGSARGMGCRRLGELAETAERIGQNDPAARPGHVVGLWAAWRRVRAFVEVRLAGLEA
jgi:HPt (histidine-containing phosphotransfer) domain-containing protein/CheY-like chemotaxis protein